MPYLRTAELPAPVRQLAQWLQRMWMRVWNRTYDAHPALAEPEREALAFAVAWAAVRGQGAKADPVVQTGPAPFHALSGVVGQGWAAQARAAPGVAKPIPVNTRSVVDVMRGMLNAREPKFERILFSTRNAQASALKYQEIRNAVRTGELSAAAMQRFRDGYSQMVLRDLAPQIQAAATSGANIMAKQGQHSPGSGWRSRARLPESTHGSRRMQQT